jgi:hypothetical protein
LLRVFLPFVRVWYLHKSNIVFDTVFMEFL